MSENSYRQIHPTAEPGGSPEHPDSFSDTSQPPTEIELTLRDIWSYVLNLPPTHVSLKKPFLSLGGDSISAMQTMGQCQKKGIGLTVQEILRSKSITDLASYAKEVQTPCYEEEEEVEKTFDLSPIQYLWFKLPNQNSVKGGHFNQSFFLRIAQNTQECNFRQAIEALISRHSMLRARFSQTSEGTWQQRITNEVTKSYRFRSHAIESQDQATSVIADSQSCLDLVNGPLFAADFFNSKSGDQLVFLVGHHLVIDLVSWRAILEELEELLKDSTTPSMVRPLPFQTWCHLQQEHSQNTQISKVLPASTIPILDFSYWGINDAENTYGNAGNKCFEMDPKTTSLFLSESHNALRTEPVDLLLSTLIHSWSQVFADRAVPAVYNEGHGREPWNPSIDISRTVGWFTTVYPVYVPASASDDLIDTVRRVKDYRRRILDNGRPYFAGRCLTAEGREAFGSHWPWEISFNYLGQYQQLERPDALLQPLESMAGEARGAGGIADVGHNAPRFGLFEISAVVVKGQLRFSFTFNKFMLHQERISNWISACDQNLRLITENLVRMSPEPTLSDFPLLELTEDRLQSMVKERLPQIGISAVDVEDAYPCSNMQEGLLLSQTKDSAYYAAVAIYEVKVQGGQTDSHCLAQAWQKVVNRHPALRTVFLENLSSDDGLYDQIVLRNFTAHVVRINCEDESEALAALKKQQSIPYDNGRHPPHRFSICQTSAGGVFCSLEISHTIMDGQSMSLLFRDLAQAYENQLREQGPLYSDYIAYLRSQPHDLGLDFWKSYLDGAEVCLFPALNDGISIEKQLCSKRLDFSSLSFSDLRNFCGDNGLTLSNLFHTAWALTLSCYIGSHDISFGYLTSARDASIIGVEDMVGPLINTLVCRVKFSETQSLLETLQHVQRDYMNSLPHRHTSLAEVQHALKLSGTALFNTALSYRKLPSQNGGTQPKITFIESAPIYDPTEYPVSINIEVSDDAAFIDLDYWTDHLSSGQADNVTSTFLHSLENIIFHSGKKLGNLDHISLRQREQILGWNVIPKKLNDCVHLKFAEQVQAQPDAPAICAFDGSFTYRELDILAENLAHYLVELGVGPEILVPTCFDKSCYTVIAMLAVLKAGGGCVPLDANHPKTALESRVEDSQARVVLASPTRAETFEDVVPDVVSVSWELLNELPALEGPACTTVQPENVAFVIFTSGSTGRPKGVILEHGAMVTSANAHGSNLGIQPGTRFLQFASYTFDNSLEEMFTTLSRGGCVCIPSEEQRMNNLAGAINELNANFMDLTPTVANLLNPADVPTIKGMALGGEALTKSVIDQWGTAVHLHGQYGPSEASINSAWKDFKDGGEPTNIGRAIGSVSWVVDPSNRNRLVPIGCKGELLIEGPILSRGYLNDREKTANAFIEGLEWAKDSKDSKRRFYCTGDLVRYNSDGEMMYLGRKDSQVKLNGQRIELGEIEHHLKLNLTADAQSAVELVTTGTQKPAKALAAFIFQPIESTTDEATILEMSDSFRATAKSLEVALSNALPAYYVPSLYIPLSTMPLTTSGKLDRKTLRTMAQALTEEQTAVYRLSGKSGRAPSTRVEKILSRVWESVLSLAPDSIGADDSFFRMGGDSIGAMRLVTSSCKEGVVLTVANIFQKPKLSDMALAAELISAVDQADNAQLDLEPFALLPNKKLISPILELVSSECDVSTDAVEDIYPCTQLQEGLIALSTREPGAYVAETIYRLPQDTDIERFRLAWQAVVQAEAILRTRIVYSEAHGFLQVVLRESICWNSAADLLEIKEEHRHLPVRNGAALTRYTIVGEGANTPYFIWTAHHAVYDGWSMPLLLSKVETCYREIQPFQLVAAPYAQFIKYLSSIDQEKSNEFWKSKLFESSAPQFPQLPHPSYQVQASNFLTHRAHVSRKSGTEFTLPCIIRAAWAFIIAMYTGLDDVVFGETNSGREAPVPGIEEILGPTIATLPIRMVIDRQKTVMEFLSEVQKQSAETLPYQFAGLQHIKKLSSDTAMACEFQNLLAINHASDGDENGLWNLQSTGTIGTNFFTYSLMASCTISRTEVEIEVHYDQNVIPTWFVQRFMHQFEFVLKRFNSAEALGEKIGDIAMLNPVDKETVWSWNSKPLKFINKSIHSMIYQEQVILRPSALAIDAWDFKATYRELDERTTRMASRLIALGVTPESYVPLCFEKSGWTVVAMLAVLKVGAAFVPLDPASPVSRLREIVSDVKAKLILCSPQYEKLCESIPAKAFSVGRAATERHPGRLYSLPCVQSNMAAYVIFTSGSTGKPKGTVIEHGSFVSNAAEFGPSFGITSTSRVLQFASYVFDASLIETLASLMVGACVCVPEESARTDNMAGVINDMRIDWAILTPSVIQLIQPSDVPQLSTLVLAGEAMSQQDLSTWSNKVVLMNGYGPSETSVVATINPKMTIDTNPANLGRAVGCRCWIAAKDNHHVLVPVGAVGELIIEGPLARGYLNNSQKTAESFVSNVRWAKETPAPGDLHERRFYKTGDLAKYNEDGTMLFLGRKDLQSKVRGQRLELGEVEHHLKTDPLVRNAIAVVPASGRCAKRLVGILCLQERHHRASQILETILPEAAAFHLTSIRNRLCERLPSYMVPSLWIAVEDFPLLPSGKSDRRRVLQWIEAMSDDVYRQISSLDQESKETEANETERKLQAIIGAVLNLPPKEVGLHQSFLHLGGDSISAMQVSGRCRSEGIGATVHDIIRSKSISQLAEKITLPQDVPQEKTQESDQPFDLAPIQQLFFKCVGDAHTHFNQSVVLRLTRKIEPGDMDNAIQALVNTHSMLRARFIKDEAGAWRQRIMKDTKKSYRFRTHQISGDVINQIQLIVQDSQTCFNILDGPVFAVDLFNIEDKYSQTVSLVAHHLVIDVVSWRILLEDLQALLNGSPIAPQSLSFQDWSKSQSKHTRQDSANTIFPFPDVPVVDLDYWGMTNQNNKHGDVVTSGFELSPKDSMLLLGAHDALATEPLDVFIAALLESFRKVFSNRPTPAIHNEGHGREPWDVKQDLSRTLGWFTTLLPIHLPVMLDEDTDIVSTIRWVKDLRGRVPQKGRPYFAYRILTEEGQRRFAGHWPAEVTFNYLGKMQQLERKDALLQPIEGITSSDVDPDVPRFALFEVTASVSQGSVKFSFSYNRYMKNQESIRNWISECQTCLQDAVERLLQLKPEPTLNDFKLMPLTYNGISKLALRLPQIGVDSLDDLEDAYPTSSMQQGLLLSQLKNPALYAYHSMFEVHSTETGQLVNTKRLAEAWQIVVRRHPALRTVFIESVTQKGRVDQVVLKERTPRTAWLKCDGEDIYAGLQEQSPINYSEMQPPHRITLCETSSGRVFCKLEISHAISDGGSIPILLRDLAQAYEGKLSTSGPLYSDYIAHVQWNSGEADINYWKVYLAGIEPCHLPILTDGKNAAKELRSLEVSLNKASELQAFCAKNGVTLSNVLQLVWALVLRCYIGTDEISFGYLSSGRDVPVRGIDDAVGCFINMLICRIDLADDLQIVRALEKIQGEFIDSMTHQNCSLAEVQHELQLPSLFNTAFTFQRRSLSRDPSKTALIFDVVEAKDPGEYAVSINADASETGVTVDFSYWTDRICQAQVSNMARTFQHVLTNIIQSQDPNLTIGELDYFSEGCRNQVMSWNNRLPESIDRCVHELIEQQALLRPLSTQAVCGWDASYTYQELNDLSQLLASHLISLGVSPEAYIPVLFEKSTWTIVAMLGIMKAGGAFVPLDPSHPSIRLKQLVKDVNSKIVLCSRKHQERASEIAETAFVVDGTMTRQLQSLSKAVSGSTVTPSNTAYIIFTSGTTGTPKGTMVEHAAFCTSATEHTKAMNLCSTSRVLQFASYTFDASVMEILSTLIVGGCVCVPNEEERLNDIPGAIGRLGVNWALLTPSVANTLKPDSVPGLRVLVTGGEAMSADHIKKWSGKVSSEQGRVEYRMLLNAYGPSETSVIATTSLKVDNRGNMLNEDAGNIGFATGGRCWIVHPRNHDKLMPIGSVGELVVEGKITARGYLRDEQKTTKAFISNPAWTTKIMPESGHFGTQRMYKTGDLVRYNSEGSFSFISRKDTQIKLNGQRIELGEIEHHVKAKLPPNVQSAVELVAPANRASTKALCVFFCTDENESGSPTSVLRAELSKLDNSDDILLPMSDNSYSIAKTLENSLAGALPSYMIPSLFVPTVKMPWTSSGKLDRHRLRNMIQSLPREVIAPYRLAYSSKKRAPTTEMETKLQRLWCTILNLQPSSVGLEDSFFRLGGDSVAAMRLVAAAHAEQIDISVVNIFREPRLSDMATICTSLARESQAQPLENRFELLKGSQSITNIIDELAEQCRIGKDLIQDAYPASSLQEAFIALTIKQPGAYVMQNVFALGLSVDIPKFKAAWQKAVDDLDILRTRIVHTKSATFVQVVLHEDSIVWHKARTLSETSGDTLRLPSHNGGALTRYTIVKDRDPKDRYFVWTIHHSLYDGWSMPLILKRVEQIYLEGTSHIPSFSYSAFVNYLIETNTQTSAQHWKDKLEGAAPTKFPQRSHSTSSREPTGRTLNYIAQITRNSNTDITVPTIIRAAWAMVIAAHTGSDDVVFGETLAGRDIPVTGITEIYGPTLTTIPNRIKIDRQSKVSSFLQELLRSSTENIPHQHAGLAAIKRLSPDASAACDFQNLLVIQAGEGPTEESLWKPQPNGAISNFFTYPLVVECRTEDTTIDIDAHFDESVISSWQIQHLLYQFESVLKQLNTVNTVSDVNVFSNHDFEMVQRWNNYQPILVDETADALFEKQALAQPNAQAICAHDGDFTYRELREHALRLAHCLNKLGVGPEGLVPLCVDKSKWTIVAIMGILMCGAGYVPLDTKHPISRHRQIVDDVKARVLLCSPSHKQNYSEIVDTVITVDGESMARLPAVYTTLPVRAPSRNPIYVIYTSGSTGKPKGVVVEHRAFCTSSAAIQKVLNIKSTSRVFQFSSLVFDVSAMEILIALNYGATVCVPSEDAKTRDVAGAITSLKATWAFLTPSVANIIESPAAVPTLETLVVGGEAMTPETVTKWADHLELINGYGPTEAAIISVANPNVSKQKDSTNIGWLLRSGRSWIVDPMDHQKLSPIGSIGELCIEGPLLAREYLNNKEKTAEVFFENPAWMKFFSTDKEHRRLYKTGDLVRYNPDGSLVYLGRKDNQVKLNGQRMELGEIEHQLQEDDAVRHAVVVMPKTGPCKHRLVATLSLNDGLITPGTGGCELVDKGRQTDIARTQMVKIRSRLVDRLPPYMVPATWAIVKAIPTLVSSKLDRKQVAAWTERMDEETYQRIMSMDADDEFSSAPATPTTKLLQQIWSRVLNIPLDEVKLNRSWLALGGDSITAMQVIAHCRKEKINLSLHEILRSKSVAQLAHCVRASSSDQTKHASEQIDQLFDLSPIQQLYFQSCGGQKGGSHFNQSFTLAITRRIEVSRLMEALNSIVTRHSMLRARFRKNDLGTWQQIIVGSIRQSYHVEVQEVERVRDIPTFISQSQRSLNIEEGPLFRASLFNVQEHNQILSMVAHHLVVDVMSWRIIIADLQDILESESPASVDKPLPFQTWCAKQTEHTRRQKANDRASSRLPFEIQSTDLAFWGMEKCSNIYADVEYDSFLVDEGLSEMALNNHQALRTEPLDIFLAAIAHSFSRVFVNRDTPAIFNEGHGREPWEFSNLDLSGTVGWFTSIFPVYVPIAENEDDVIETVKRMKDIRRRIPGNGRPYFAYRYLTEEGKREYGHHMPMEILFNYLGKMQQLEQDDSLFQQVQFAEEDDSKISDVGANTSRLALFEISASVIRNRIQFTFMYNRQMRNQKGIRRWVAECQQTLAEIARSLADIQEPEPTLSDFPLLPLESYDRLKRMTSETFPAAGITKFSEVEDIYPSSPMQEGMLLSQLRVPNSYLFHSTFEVKSQDGVGIDVLRLAKAWQKVADRHPALRTIFVDSVCRGGVFDQIVIKHADSGVILIECDDAEVFARLDAVKLIETNYKRQPRLPHQLTICRTKSGKVFFKMEINHAVIDGGSQAVIVRDFAAAYDDRLPEGSGPPYSDYIKYLRNQPPNADIKYWKTYLEGIQPCHFPILCQEPVTERRQSSVVIEFDRFSELQGLCERSNVTLSNVMLAAWAIVLRIYTGSSDVCYGYLASGRDVPINDIQDTVGAFINMLVCRVNFSSPVSLLETFKKVQHDFIESLPYQHCSLAKVQHDLNLSGKTLFNTAVSIQNHTPSADADELSTTFEQLSGYDPSEYAVTVNIETGRNDEGVLFRYWTDVISDADATKLAITMSKVLSNIASSPEQTIGELDVAISTEKQDSTIQKEQQDPVTQTEQQVSPSQHTSPPRQIKQGDIPATPDWSSLIRSIVNEVVPEVLDQMFQKGKLTPYNDPAREMVGMISRRASQALRGGQLKELRAAVESGARRMSNAENRINIAADMVAAAGSVPPNLVERKLLSLWSELLDMVEDSIGKDDSFFQLGGDSIIAMRLVGAAREEGLSMTVADVFRNPTFADMARVVRVAGEVIDQVITNQTNVDTNASQAQRQTQGEESQSSVKRDWNVPQVTISKSDNDVRELGEVAAAQQAFGKWGGFTERPTSHLSDRSPSEEHTGSTIEEDLYRAFSLLSGSNPDSNGGVDSFLQSSIVPKVQVFRGGIIDALPVTDFQALAITGALLESKWMLNYFYLDGNGPLDLKKLKQSAFRLVQAFDIMRTVFVPYGDRFLQVILRKLQPEFVVHETELDLDEFTAQLQQRDRENGPRLGETFVQFTVAKRKGTDHHRIFMRLSHAQYDGVCMPKIFGALQAGYNGQPIPSAPTFSNYVRESAGSVSRNHYNYWKGLLYGSKMTEIVRHEGPDYQRTAGETTTIKQTVRVASLSCVNITPATVIKAAWSSVLAQITGESDIVFGHVISGRNTCVPGVENIIGPCLNMVPVRVRFQSVWTVLDLLRFVQDQQVANMPFEALGFREITKHCTDWPDWTNFSSVLQHQNIDRDATLQLGETSYKVAAAGSQEEFADFTVVSSPQGGDQVEISLTFSEHNAIAPRYAQNVLSMLATTASSFAENPHKSLPSPAEIAAIKRSPLGSENKSSESLRCLSVPDNMNGLNHSEILVISETLRGAWRQILRDEKGQFVTPDLNSSFFELGGDIMGLVQVASLLDQEGFKVRVEDLIDHPILLEQVALLSLQVAQEKEKETASPWGIRVPRWPEQPSEQEKVQKKGLNVFLVKSVGLARKFAARRRARAVEVAGQ
ncbi:nonribosomal peptide synthase-like protein [Glonium stellatum]|uniref:Nonribosomal peptide synthase-like protein n=1 Tax=Glonium stellatum TaxID=574774 RepID=A0A8E2F4Y8_9PEZI|nr:nonribosomal peptide synthase-like protein [Glonium stellatum]